MGVRGIRVTRQSILSGVWRTRELPITLDELIAVEDPQRTALIQDLLPSLPAEDREFLLTGITSEEWEEFDNANEDDV